GRRDRPQELGAIKASITLGGAADFSRIAGASVQGELYFADDARLEFAMPALSARSGRFKFGGKVELAKFRAMVPPTLALLHALISTIRGIVEVNIEGKVDVAKGMEISTAHLSATDFAIAWPR
ncbi:MAG TPA: hypothetical protein VIL86_07615, partial [Tepidisphaeraceae bacterium]